MQLLCTSYTVISSPKPIIKSLLVKAIFHKSSTVYVLSPELLALPLEFWTTKSRFYKALKYYTCFNEYTT